MYRLIDLDTFLSIGMWSSDSELYFAAWGFDGSWESTACHDNRMDYFPKACNVLAKKFGSKRWLFYYGDPLICSGITE